MVLPNPIIVSTYDEKISLSLQYCHVAPPLTGWFNCGLVVNKKVGYTWVLQGPFEAAIALGSLAKGYEEQSAVRELDEDVRATLMAKLVAILYPKY